jgi:hypothetical protein
VEDIKRCNTCLETKPFNDFHSCGNGKTRGKCRECYNNEYKNKYKNDLEFKEKTKNKAKKWKDKKLYNRQNTVTGESVRVNDS